MTNQKNPAKQAKTLKSPSSQSDTTTFSDHVRELRRRILWVALLFAGTSAIAYNYHDQLVQLVMSPLKGEKLIYLTPGGGFSFIFQITLYAGLIAAAPMLMYQLYGFVRPTLPVYAKRSTVKVACFAILLMMAGVGYGYFVAVPAALNFLSTFAGAEIVPNLTADSYLNFFLSYVGGLALLFQLPLLLIFWHWIKPMKPGGLLKSERLVILFAFIAAALITPTPDVVNQAMIAVPLIAIYQIGVVVVLIAIWRSRKRQKAQQPAIISAPSQPTGVLITPVAVSPTSRPSVTMPVVATQARPIRRSIDGFSSRPARTAPLQPVTRPLTIPPRSSPSQGPFLNRRPVLRIDGMSPM